MDGTRLILLTMFTVVNVAGPPGSFSHDENLHLLWVLGGAVAFCILGAVAASLPRRRGHQGAVIAKARRRQTRPSFR